MCYIEHSVIGLGGGGFQSEGDLPPLYETLRSVHESARRVCFSWQRTDSSSPLNVGILHWNPAVIHAYTDLQEESPVYLKCTWMTLYWSQEAMESWKK